MKLAAALFCSLIALPVFAGQSGTNSPINIPALEAKKHIGTNAVVSGKIVEISKAEKLVRLNFDKPFPEQPFTAVIFASKTNLFPDLDRLKDKQVQVSGNITDFRGRAQIVLNATNQLKVLEEASGKKE